MDKRKKTTSSKPQITIVIGTLNRPKAVLKLIDQLKKEEFYIEIIVVDQSENENYLLLKEKFPSDHNFKLSHFVTPNTCRYLNYGWKQAKADIVLYLDDDVTITKDTISSHVNAYADSLIMGVAGRVINDGELISKNSTVGRVLWYGAVVTKNFTYEKRTKVEFPYGCNMSFRKVVLERVDGFDERLAPPMYSFNELDMGIRVNKIWKNSIVFIPEALVYHHQYKSGGTRNDFSSAEAIKGNNFNYGFFVGKNYNIFENLVFFIRRFPYQILKESGSIRDFIKGFYYAKKISV